MHIFENFNNLRHHNDLFDNLFKNHGHLDNAIMCNNDWISVLFNDLCYCFEDLLNVIDGLNDSLFLFDNDFIWDISIDLHNVGMFNALWLRKNMASILQILDLLNNVRDCNDFVDKFLNVLVDIYKHWNDSFDYFNFSWSLDEYRFCKLDDFGNFHNWTDYFLCKLLNFLNLFFSLVSYNMLFSNALNLLNFLLNIGFLNLVEEIFLLDN